MNFIRNSNVFFLLKNSFWKGFDINNFETLEKVILSKYID